MSLIREWNDVYEKDLSKIISFLEAEIHNQPTLLILSGPVGAGKTTFSKKLISKLLKEDDNDLEVVSPTYSVINKIDEIVHADFYRIESEEELIHLELSLYLENCKLLIVEWGKDYYSSLKEEVGDDFKTLELVIDFEIKNDQQVTTSRTAKLFNLC
ncbi:MAG: tRNA (adenosine(37)-N6)-threonylcarbamoyltransferase complex ATPase subunit type 1 TsaE [Bdellovibrionales bacterium]|nr:tRNA (adenosine(37)-N6)-threonylcarbamoyltransferase complex ATPase subunit type 1 TsaE [Bdellovibrionales bacterium]